MYICRSSGGLAGTCFNTHSETRAHIRHLPFSATPLRRIAIMALLMSSSEAMVESTLTTSKSTGTQQKLIIKTDGDHFSVTERSHLVAMSRHDSCACVCAGCVNSHRNSSRTWLASSGPIPSPGMRVTVCLPPYCAGGGCNECTYTNTESQSPLHKPNRHIHYKTTEKTLRYW